MFIRLNCLAFGEIVINFIPARRYTIARYMLSSCVRLSQAGIVSKRLDESSWHGGFLQRIPRCVMRKFGYLRSKDTSFWNFVPKFRLREFRHGKSIALSTNSSSSSTVELVDDTYATIDKSWLFTASRSTVTL